MTENVWYSGVILRCTCVLGHMLAGIDKEAQ